MKPNLFGTLLPVLALAGIAPVTGAVIVFNDLEIPIPANFSGVYLGHLGTDPGQFTPGVQGYLGFVLDPESATPRFGWLSATLQDDGNPGIIHNIAFSDAPLQVGAVPEPSTTILAAFSSLLLLRRRQ